MSLDELDSAWFTRFRRQLRRWYQQNARDLPWRRTTDPYRIWISEIMLQQTTVVAVIPYYERFLKRFPTVHKLAAADQQDVLKLWEGLGYYSRARNIHKAAKAVVSEYDGEFPQSAEALQKLPGIGRYTAGAIASFAFDLPAPIVEANTLRLYSRVLGYAGDPRSKEGQSLLWEFAERVLPRKQPGQLNQALMELGGTICSVSEPSCSECPVQKGCRAFASGSQSTIPLPKARPKVTFLTHANVVVRRKNKVLIRQHTSDERWSGLWDFPRYELAEELAADITPIGKQASLFKPPVKVRSYLADQVRIDANIEVDVKDAFKELTHTVTRYRIRLVCFEAEYGSGRTKCAANTQWVSVSQLDDYPLTMTARKVAKALG